MQDGVHPVAEAVGDEAGKSQSGQWIVNLRVIHLSGVWSEVYQSYLGSKATLVMRSQGTTAKGRTSEAA